LTVFFDPALVTGKSVWMDDGVCDVGDGIGLVWDEPPHPIANTIIAAVAKA
jgi:hypothetical protein